MRLPAIILAAGLLAAGAGAASAHPTVTVPGGACDVPLDPSGVPLNGTPVVEAQEGEPKPTVVETYLNGNHIGTFLPDGDPVTLRAAAFANLPDGRHSIHVEHRDEQGALISSGGQDVTTCTVVVIPAPPPEEPPDATPGSGVVLGTVAPRTTRVGRVVTFRAVLVNRGDAPARGRLAWQGSLGRGSRSFGLRPGGRVIVTRRVVVRPGVRAIGARFSATVGSELLSAARRVEVRS